MEKYLVPSIATMNMEVTNPSIVGAGRTAATDTGSKIEDYRSNSSMVTKRSQPTLSNTLKMETINSIHSNIPNNNMFNRNTLLEMRSYNNTQLRHKFLVSPSSALPRPSMLLSPLSLRQKSNQGRSSVRNWSLLPSLAQPKLKHQVLRLVSSNPVLEVLSTILMLLLHN